MAVRVSPDGDSAEPSRITQRRRSFDAVAAVVEPVQTKSIPLDFQVFFLLKASTSRTSSKATAAAAILLCVSLVQSSCFFAFDLSVSDSPCLTADDCKLGMACVQDEQQTFRPRCYGCDCIMNTPGSYAADRCGPSDPPLQLVDGTARVDNTTQFCSDQLASAQRLLGAAASSHDRCLFIQREWLQTNGLELLVLILSFVFISASVAQSRQQLFLCQQLRRGMMHVDWYFCLRDKLPESATNNAVRHRLAFALLLAGEIVALLVYAPFPVSYFWLITANLGFRASATLLSSVSFCFVLARMQSLFSDVMLSHADKERHSVLLGAAMRQSSVDFLEAKRRGQLRGACVFGGLLYCLMVSRNWSCTSAHWLSRQIMGTSAYILAPIVEAVHAACFLRPLPSTRRGLVRTGLDVALASLEGPCVIMLSLGVWDLLNRLNHYSGNDRYLASLAE